MVSLTCCQSSTVLHCTPSTDTSTLVRKCWLVVHGCVFLSFAEGWNYLKFAAGAGQSSCEYMDVWITCHLTGPIKQTKCHIRSVFFLLWSLKVFLGLLDWLKRREDSVNIFFLFLTLNQLSIDWTWRSAYFSTNLIVLHLSTPSLLRVRIPSQCLLEAKYLFHWWQLWHFP